MSRFFIDNYAIDLSKKSISVSDVYDSQALLQSVENIILTIPGERVFQLDFGSPLMTTTFRNINEQNGERLLDAIIDAINKFEPRVRVISSKCVLQLIPSQNSLNIVIPFIIIKSGAYLEYTKKLTA
jgi:phage baseplate assembly protein W